MSGYLPPTGSVFNTNYGYLYWDGMYQLPLPVINTIVTCVPNNIFTNGLMSWNGMMFVPVNNITYGTPVWDVNRYRYWDGQQLLDNPPSQPQPPQSKPAFDMSLKRERSQEPELPPLKKPTTPPPQPPQPPVKKPTTPPPQPQPQSSIQSRLGPTQPQSQPQSSIQSRLGPTQPQSSIQSRLGPTQPPQSSIQSRLGPTQPQPQSQSQSQPLGFRPITPTSRPPSTPTAGLSSMKLTSTPTPPPAAAAFRTPPPAAAAFRTPPPAAATFSRTPPAAATFSRTPPAAASNAPPPGQVNTTSVKNMKSDAARLAENLGLPSMPRLPNDPNQATQIRLRYWANDANDAVRLAASLVSPFVALTEEEKERERVNETERQAIARTQMFERVQGPREQIGQNLWTIIDDNYLRDEIERLDNSKGEESNLLAQAFYYATHPVPTISPVEIKKMSGNAQFAYNLASNTWKLGRYGIVVTKQSFDPNGDTVRGYHAAVNSGLLTPEMRLAASNAGTQIPSSPYNKIGGWYIRAQIVDVRELNLVQELENPITLADLAPALAVPILPPHPEALAEFDLLYRKNTTERTRARHDAIIGNYPVKSSMLEPAFPIYGLHISVHMEQGHIDQTHLKFNIGTNTHSIVLYFILINNNLQILQINNVLATLKSVFVSENITEEHANDLTKAFFHFLEGLKNYINIFIDRTGATINGPTSIKDTYGSEPFNYNKYLKYKTKYLQLKKKINNI